MYTLSFFGSELDSISNKNIRIVVTELMSLAPKYFWSAPASTSGKYHPKISLGDGGLFRHVKAAFHVLLETMGNATIIEELFFPKAITPLELDAIKGAILLHDLCKEGLEDGGGHSVAEHPLLVRKLVAKLPKEMLENLSPDEKSALNVMILAIESHMGQWNTGYKSKEQILPRPKNNLQRFVHYCDYIASRKFMNIEV